MSLLNVYETISFEISKFFQSIETKSHPRYLSLLIVFLENLTQDAWIFHNSPPWRWMYRSSVGKFHTVNVRKQELRKSRSLVDLLGKSLTFNLCCYACYLLWKKKLNIKTIDMYVLNVSYRSNCRYGEYLHKYALNFTKYAWFQKWDA